MRATTPDEFREEIRLLGKWDEWKAMQRALVERGSSKHEAWGESAKMFGYRGRDATEDAEAKRKERRRGPVESASGLAPRDAFEGKRGNVRGDFNWVYENLSVMGVVPEDAPSPGAWGLLQFAREDKKEFYRSWMGMAAKEADGDAMLQSFEADASRTSKEIGRMLDGLRTVREDSEGSPGKPRLETRVVLGGGNGSSAAEGPVDSV